MVNPFTDETDREVNGESRSPRRRRATTAQRVAHLFEPDTYSINFWFSYHSTSGKLPIFEVITDSDEVQVEL